ncbi:MAG: hypothetical protein AUH85_18095 [Chloroflexi bacterium 13_1_40CM_4_68_4]|nr:MAG: hypothetical protein AUH85_18095 [Chloroflexi bacterium 13_1_40CM_4_68_4]
MGKRFVSVVLVSAFVAACGGGASTTTTASAGASAAATSAATSAVTNAPSGASTAPSAATGPKLLDLLTAGKAASYKISYKLTASGAGAEAFSGTQSWYFKPPRSRFDFSSSVGGQVQSLSIFSVPDGQFMCFSQGGQATCLSVPSTGSPMDANLAASFQGSLVDHPDQYGGTFTGTKTIAGMQGSCYDVKATAAAATGLSSGSFCYSKDGIPLLSQFSAQGSSWSMEATNVSTTVPDSDFTLPAKPTVIGYP